MQVLKQQSKQKLALFTLGTLLSVYHPAMAETDQAARENYLKALVTSHQQTDHTAHKKPIESNQEFHGVFYGFIPCNDCPGVKMTLSLKQNNNYLLVTQYARESSREIYEKGKYSWDDKNQTVILTSRKDQTTRHYFIEGKETLIQLNSDGTRITGDLADRYILRRSDAVKSREVHMH